MPTPKKKSKAKDPNVAGDWLTGPYPEKKKKAPGSDKPIPPIPDSLLRDYMAKSKRESGPVGGAKKQADKDNKTLKTKTFKSKKKY